MSSQAVLLNLAQEGPRTYHVAKFRDNVAELDDAEQCELALNSEVLRVQKSGEDKFKEFDGAQEQVGSGSSYFLLRMDDNERVAEVIPVADWRAFRPCITHQTFSTEDAEAALEKHDHTGTLAEERIGRLRRHGAGVDGEDPTLAMSLMEDDFDGGGQDAHEGEADEDGREGLDMEGDDLFDDDDDEFEEEDELAIDARQEAKKLNAAGASRLRLHTEEGDGEEAAQDDAASEWKMVQKGILKEERDRKREDSDSSSGSDDEAYDEGKALLRSVLRNGQQPSYEDGGRLMAHVAEDEEEEESNADKATGEAGTTEAGEPLNTAPEPAAGSKRKPSYEDDSKRARARTEPAASAESSAAPAVVAPPPRTGAVASGRQAVLEIDVVKLLHQKRQMRLKELIAQFKPLMPEKADKKRFMEIVTTVAKLTKVDGESLCELKDEALFKYKLEN